MHRYTFAAQNNPYGDPAKVDPVLGQIFGSHDVSSSSEANNQQVKSDDSNNIKSLFTSSTSQVDTNDSNGISNSTSSSYGIYNVKDNRMPVNHQIEQQCSVQPTMASHSTAVGSYNMAKSNKDILITKDFTTPIDDHYPANVTTKKKNICRKSTKKTLKKCKQNRSPSKVKARSRRSSVACSKRLIYNLDSSTKDRGCNTRHCLGKQVPIYLRQDEMR